MSAHGLPDVIGVPSRPGDQPDPGSAVIHGRPRAFPVFIACTVLGALGAIGGLAATSHGWSEVRDHPLTAGILAGLLLLTELMPVVLVRRRTEVEVATSTTFTLALLLVAGIGPAVVAQVVASLLADLREHKHPLKIAFNLSQFVIAIAAGGGVLVGLGGDQTLHGGALRASEIGPAIAAAIVFIVVNNLLVWTVVSLADQSGLGRRIADEWPFTLATSLVLAGLAPVIVFVAVNALAMLPLLLIPAGAVYLTARSSLAQAHLALHDGLTGLSNRVHFRAELEETLAGGSSRRLAVFMIDLDHFKEVNDTLGHHTGDLVLVGVGPRVVASSRMISLVARMGGDQFAVLVDDIHDADQAIEVAGALTQALQEPFVLDDGLIIELEASIGVVVTPEHGESPDLLLQRVDVAMHLAKASRTGIALYAPERDDNSRRRLTLIGQLRTAIANSELTLHYQPKLNLATNRFFAVEALIRWFHPELGSVTPDEFIPLAERSGLIKPLTRFVLHTAINQTRQWHLDGLPLRMAVNLSARSLVDESLPSTVAALLADAGVDPSWLELEITETELMVDPERGAMVLARLHAMGIRLTIDDFGTGYSSLAYLASLPVNEIKIDRCFVSALGGEDSANDIIVRSTIDLARNLGLEVTAEGVETVDQLERLAVLGCHFLQGFFLSRPVPADELFTFVTATLALTRPARDEKPS